MDYRISLIGLFIGFLVGLTGMGGGALLAPIMILVLRVPLSGLLEPITPIQP